MEKVTLPEMARGVWRVERFEAEYCDIGEARRGRTIPVGETYTRLLRGAVLVMSDTPAEMRDHWEAVMRATGSCLVNGLGLGMLLKNILLKSEVAEVTVVEQSEDVLAMVAPHYPDPRVTFVQADAFAYKPPRGKRYDMVWHDIWDTMCGDNVGEMMALRRKYRRYAAWQGCWGEAVCREVARRNRQFEKQFGRCR